MGSYECGLKLMQGRKIFRPYGRAIGAKACELLWPDRCPCAVAGGKPPFPPNAPARIGAPATNCERLASSPCVMSSQGRWKNKTLRGAAPQTPRQGNDSPAPAILDAASRKMPAWDSPRKLRKPKLSPQRYRENQKRKTGAGFRLPRFSLCLVCSVFEFMLK
jgi:hypothetical protein